MEMFGQYNAPAGATYPAGGGKAGIRMAGQWADDTADMIIRSFTREPLTYESYDPDLAGTFTPFPHAWPLPTLPGDIDGPPALADFRFTPAAQGGSSDVGQGAWACLGWAARDGGHNMLGVGSFDEEGTGNLKYVFATARAPIVAGGDRPRHRRMGADRQRRTCPRRQDHGSQSGCMARSTRPLFVWPHVPA
jgi:hypothetical protein